MRNYGQWDCTGFNGDGSDTSKIPHGEPHAGKPHVTPLPCCIPHDAPVQFLPAYDPLLQEALVQARSFDYEGVETKVMLAEYLAAICVKTGRLKDKLRVQMLQLSRGFSESQFLGLLSTFNLKERFEKWQLQ